jgi:hypothetical protein
LGSGLFRFPSGAAIVLACPSIVIAPLRVPRSAALKNIDFFKVMV